DEMVARKANAELGIEQLQQARLELAAIDLGFAPQILTPFLVDMNSMLVATERADALANLALYGGEVLGTGIPQTYLIFLVDNSRPMPIGGELSAYLLLTLQNGGISEARLQSIDAFTPSLKSLPQYAVDEIDLRSFA